MCILYSKILLGLGEVFTTFGTMSAMFYVLTFRIDSFYAMSFGMGHLNSFQPKMLIVLIQRALHGLTK